MPTYTAISPTLVLCQQLADAVLAAWNPSAPSLVDWDFVRRLSGPDALSKAKIEGRRVIFYPDRYGWEPETRQEENYTHKVWCEVAERYDGGTGDPPKEWTAERVDFVHTQIVAGLRFTRHGPPEWNPMLMTLGAEVEVLDREKLLSAGRLFYALVELEFMELVQ